MIWFLWQTLFDYLSWWLTYELVGQLEIIGIFFTIQRNQMVSAFVIYGQVGWSSQFMYIIPSPQITINQQQQQEQQEQQQQQQQQQQWQKQ